MSEFREIADWLQNTVIGVIILGALGSLLALVLIKIFQYVWILVKYGKERAGDWLAKHDYDPYFISGYSSSDDNSVIDKLRILVLCVGLLSKLIVLLSVLICSILIFGITLLTSESVILSGGTFFSAVMAFLSIKYAYSTYKDIYYLYRSHVETEIDAEIKEWVFEENTGAEDESR